jgi:hypothetical protein
MSSLPSALQCRRRQRSSAGQALQLHDVDGDDVVPDSIVGDEAGAAEVDLAALNIKRHATSLEGVGVDAGGVLLVEGATKASTGWQITVNELAAPGVVVLMREFVVLRSNNHLPPIYASRSSIPPTYTHAGVGGRCMHCGV